MCASRQVFFRPAGTCQRLGDIRGLHLGSLDGCRGARARLPIGVRVYRDLIAMSGMRGYPRTGARERLLGESDASFSRAEG